MITKASNNMDINEFASKVMKGMKKANRKLVETAALNDRTLIIGDDQGGFKAVPAKELLKKLPQ